MNKRDRMVKVYLHRVTHNALLFPYVVHMGGEGAAFGDATEIVNPTDPTLLGREIARLLRNGRKANLEDMKNRHMDRLRRYWRGEIVSAAHSVPPTSWSNLWKMYPVLEKGPASYLRQFAVCNVIERNESKNWKITRTIRSAHRGGTTDGESRLVARGNPRKLGLSVIELLDSPI